MSTAVTHEGCETKIALLEDEVEALRVELYELKRQEEARKLIASHPFGFLLDLIAPPDEKPTLRLIRLQEMVREGIREHSSNG